MIRNDHIVQRVVFAAGRDELFAWLTEPERLAAWMGEAARVEPWPGGALSCLLPDGQVWDGVVVEIEAPARLVFTLGWRDPAMGMPVGMSLVEWDLALHARGSELRMTHQHVPPELLVLLNDTWARLFARLRNLLAGRPAGPHPLAGLPGRQARG
ncbi:MAG TPA: SRPBCC domain-containing protein [Frankiaceae bacterium]|nr:SRPBCC domain-containing protein [Frankiaceae bacterium]